MSAMQLATNKRLRWPADNVTFSGGNACELTKFLLPLVANRSLPVRRSSNGVLLQIDDGPGSLLFHASDRFPHAEKRAAHVGGENFIPHFTGRILDVPPRAYACIVNEHVDATINLDRLTY